MKPAPVLKSMLAKLKKSPDAIPWGERRALALQLSEKVQDEESRTDEILAAIELLARDSKPEVRKEIAELLYHLPEENFRQLAAILSSDSSFFVQKAVERSMDRRRKGSEALQRLRRNLEQVDTQLRTIEKYHGKQAAERARKLADSHFSILVGETVHDIRNVLSPIRSTLSLLINQIDQGKPNMTSVRADLLSATDRVDYLDRFINEMREYSQSSPDKRHRERIADLINEAKRLALENLKIHGFDASSIEVTVTAPQNLSAEVTRHQVVIALNHVIRNAIESFEMPNCKTKDRKISIRATVVRGDLEISVQDNGPGIHEEDLQEYRKFNPGHTTKKSYGTGFGLPTAKRCAQAHDGDLSIHSEVGLGTTVTMVFPLEGRNDE